jgi:hypothetical protein
MKSLRRVSVLSFSLRVGVLALGGRSLAMAGDENWESGFGVVCEASGQAIRALAFNQQGELFIGGSLFLVGAYPGVRVGNIAKWNGQNWSSLAGGVNGAIRTIIANGDDIYVGGAFTSAGGVAATNLARWDGTNWWPVGGGPGGSVVNALVVDGKTLYVGGTFTNAGGVSVHNIAAWDGQNWSSLGDGVAGKTATVNTLLDAGGQLLVGGDFQSAGGISASNVARWTGSAWTSLGNGLIGPSFVLTTDDAGTVYAGGGQTSGGPPYISKWDGAAWSSLPAGDPGLNDPVNLLFIYNNALYAGGLYLGGPAPVGDLERFDGTNWVRVGAPFGLVRAGPVQHQTKLYFSGALNNVMHLNPAAGSWEYGVAAWDGAEWTMLGACLSIFSLATIPTVRSLVAVGPNLIAGGHLHDVAGNVSFPPGWEDTIAQWNGRIWSKLGNGIVSAQEVLSLATDGSVVYAGGSFGSQVMKWDGTNWSSLGSGLPGSALALAVGDGAVLAGGSFGVQKWDGTSWTSLGANVNGSVYAIVARINEVFVGGNFTQAGSLSAQNIARWDGTNWSALGSGLDAAVNALVFRGST